MTPVLSMSIRWSAPVAMILYLPGECGSCPSFSRIPLRVVLAINLSGLVFYALF
jgi:hypothetical protein